MITTKSELKRIVALERCLYFKSNKKLFEAVLVKDKDWRLFCFQKYLRYSEYHYNSKQNSLFHRLLYIYYRRRKNILGLKLGIEIWENSFDEGLRIWHAGDIVVNGYTKIGKNCQLKGDNCIGNTGKNLKAPTIGDNFSLGNGAKVIGDITLADNIEVGAGAIVLKSCDKDGAVLVGVPAVNIKTDKGAYYAASEN